MPAVTRTFRILNEIGRVGRHGNVVVDDDDDNDDGNHGDLNESKTLILTEQVHVVLHEPTMDGDNLGLKTWGAAYMLAKRLGLLEFRELVGLTTLMAVPGFISSCGSFSDEKKKKNDDFRILELGSGTGLVGIATAAILSSSSCGTNSSISSTPTAISIHLTDLPEVFPNLAKNISLNMDNFANRHHENDKVDINLTAGILDWREDITPPNIDDKYPFILVADPLYSKDHPKWLSDVIAGWLEKSSTARVVVELPLREVYIDVVRNFWSLMRKKGLELVDEGKEVGRDDWGSESDGEEMKCWWGVWKWMEE